MMTYWKLSEKFFKLQCPPLHIPGRKLEDKSLRIQTQGVWRPVKAILCPSVPAPVPEQIQTLMGTDFRPGTQRLFCKIFNFIKGDPYNRSI